VSTVLPPLEWHPSPNYSQRHHGIVPYLIVLHRPVGSYQSALTTLTKPRGDASVSSHVLVGRPQGWGVVCAQLVPWDQKAWTCAAFNSMSYNLEIADAAWTGDDEQSLAAAARLVAFLCTRTEIPPTWTPRPLDIAGVTRHFDLGRAGGGHTDPTTDTEVWRAFMRRVQAEHKRGGFRKTYGRGRLVQLP
jgi:N-acetyl-anhydromuramyl-L-alanine amidase AmpD